MNKEIQPKTEQNFTNQQRLIMLGLNHVPDGNYPDNTDKKFETDMLESFTPILFEPEESFRQEYFQFYAQVTESVICKFSGTQNEPPDPKLLQDDLIKIGGRIGVIFKERNDFEFEVNEYIEEEYRPSYAVSRVCDLMNHIYMGLNNHFDLKAANLAKREQISRGIFDRVFPFEESYPIEDIDEIQDPSYGEVSTTVKKSFTQTNEIFSSQDNQGNMLAAD